MSALVHTAGLGIGVLASQTGSTALHALPRYLVQERLTQTPAHSPAGWTHSRGSSTLCPSQTSRIRSSRSLPNQRDSGTTSARTSRRTEPFLHAADGNQGESTMHQRTPGGTAGIDNLL